MIKNCIFQSEIFDILLSDRDLDDVLKYIGSILQRDLLLLNTNYIVLNSTTSEFKRKEKLKLTYFDSDKKLTDIYKMNQEEEERNKREGIFYLLAAPAQKIGFLIILEPKTEYDHLYSNGQQAAALLTFILAKEEEVLSTQKKYKDAFLFDLLYGNFETAQDIVSQGKIWDWDFSQPHQVIVFSAAEFEPFAGQKVLKHELLDLVNEEAGKESKPICLYKNQEVILILPVKNLNMKEHKKFIQVLMRKILLRANNELAPLHIIAGVGRTYESPQDIFRSFQEAKVALKLGHMQGPGEDVPFFKDLGLTRILYNHDRQELLEFYAEILGDLINTSGSNNEFVDTLEKYLIHKGDLKETAQALFLHPNTLRYRLKKIEEILDLNLEDLDTKLSLLTAFKIKRLMSL